MFHYFGMIVAITTCTHVTHGSVRMLHVVCRANRGEVDNMAAEIRRLRTRADRLRADQADELRQLVLTFAEQAGRELSERAVGQVIAAIDRQTASDTGWTFLMISPAQHDAVLEWLLERTHSAKLASRVWSKCFTNLRRDTGEIMLSRSEIAALVGAPVNEVSRVLSLLCQCGALIRHRERGSVARFFMNPLVGTKLSGQDRDRAQAEAPEINLPDVPDNVAQLHHKTKQTGVVRS
jgi:hypothetical protein